MSKGNEPTLPLLPCPSARRWRRRRHRTCVHPRARWRAPPRGTQRRTVSSTSSFPGSFCRPRRRRRRLAPPWASSRRPRHHIRRRMARAGPTWESERSSSVARARQGARRKGRARRSMASGEMVGTGWEPLRPPTRLEPAAAGRRRAVQGEAGQILGRTHGGRIKGGPSQYPEKAAALAFFRVPRITLIMSRDRVTEYRERRAQSRPLVSTWPLRGDSAHRDPSAHRDR